jgi:hypothetical protein
MRTPGQPLNGEIETSRVGSYNRDEPITGEIQGRPVRGVVIPAKRSTSRNLEQLTKYSGFRPAPE